MTERQDGEVWPRYGYAPDGYICGHCKLAAKIDPDLFDVVANVPTPPDPCIGKLPGVLAACCGHGKQGYIWFENGVCVRFENMSVDPWENIPVRRCYQPDPSIPRFEDKSE